MDRVTIDGLAMWKSYENYREVARAAGLSEAYLSQIRNGVRRPSQAARDALERVLAVGNPAPGEERVYYVLGRSFASGELEVPDDPHGIPLWQSRDMADEAVRHLRENGFPGALAIPVWENGIGQILGPDATTKPAESDLFRSLVRGFNKTKRGGGGRPSHA